MGTYREQVNNAGAAGNKIRAALDSMSGAERKLPAIVGAGPAGATGYDMVSAQGPYTHRVVTPNLDFWRARKSRIEVRGVEVWFSPSSLPAVHKAVWQAYKKLNWDAVRALVQ